MKLADLFVRLGLKKDGFDKGLDDSKKKTNAFGSAVKKIGGIVAGAFAVERVASFVSELVQLGGVADGVRDAFKRIADDRTLQGLKEATRGTVSELELMKRAVSAQNLGLPVENLANLFEFATKRAQDTGESVDYLVNSIVTGIGRKSPLILDNLGISAVQLREKLKGVGMETASVADVAAAVGEIAAESMKNSGEIIDTNAVKIQRLGAMWEDLKTKIATNKKVIDSVGNSLNKFQQTMYVWTSDNATALEKWAISFELFDKRAEKLYNQVKKREDELNALRSKTNSELNQMLDSEISKRDELAGRIEYQSKTYKALVGRYGYAGAKKLLKELRSEYRLQSKAVYELTKQIDDINRERNTGNKHIDEETAAYRNQIAAEQDAYELKVKNGKTISQIKEETDKLKASIESYGINQDAEIQKTLQQIAANEKLIESLTTLRRTQNADVPDLMQTIGLSGDEFSVAAPDASVLANMDAFKAKINERLANLIDEQTLQAMKDNFNKMEEVSMQLTSALESGLVSAFQGIGSAIGESLTGGSWSDFGAAILKIIGQFMQTLGGAIIAIGVGLLELEAGLASANPFAVIGAGIALTAAGAALSSIVSGGITGSGGGAYSGATANTSGSSASAAIYGDVRFVLEGDKLVGAINNNSTKRRLTR